MKTFVLALAALAVGGCVSLPARPPAELDPANPQAAGGRAVEQPLAGALTLDLAVEIALARNQGLAALSEELAIAQADLAEAGLVKNPVVSARLGFAPGGRTADAIALSEDFLQILTLPTRKRVGEAQLEAAKARVGAAALELTAQVKSAVIALQAAQSAAQVRKLVLEAWRLAAELRRRQHKAGNVGDLELLQEESFYQQGKLEVGRAELAAALAREHVNRLLGLWGKESDSWSVADRLPDLPDADPDLAQVESLAIGRRLDLQAARSEAQALEEAASAAGYNRAIPSLRLGVSTERDAEGTRTFGPTLELELPVFDQGRPAVARIEAQVRQARARHADLAVAIRSEVRGLRSRLAAAREVAEHFRKTLLPLREKLVEQAQLRYNSMLLGVFQLLLARREQGDAYRDYLESIRDYWTARFELERAAGGALGTAAQEKKP